MAGVKGKCIEWRGEVTNAGYPKANGHPLHRFIWSIHNGCDVPEHTIVRAACGNKSCVNPRHLEIVNASEHYASLMRDSSKDDPSQFYRDVDLVYTRLKAMGANVYVTDVAHLVGMSTMSLGNHRRGVTKSAARIVVERLTKVSRFIDSAERDASLRSLLLGVLARRPITRDSLLLFSK